MSQGRMGLERGDLEVVAPVAARSWSAVAAALALFAVNGRCSDPSSAGSTHACALRSDGTVDYRGAPPDLVVW